MRMVIYMLSSYIVYMLQVLHLEAVLSYESAVDTPAVDVQYLQNPSPSLSLPTHTLLSRRRKEDGHVTEVEPIALAGCC